MKRTPLKRKIPLRSRSKLRVEGHSDVAEIKRNIQALLREAVIARDKGCVMRHFPEAGACGGYRRDGALILQFEHLVTRANSASFGDVRLGVCLCQRHHIFWKPQHSQLYWQLIERQIGPERWNLLQRVLADRSPHRFYLADWKAIEAALRLNAST